jgi:hypothetical protein
MCWLALAANATAQSPANQALTNADIVKMAHAGIPESIIVREIQTSDTNLSTSPDALIELKRQGVSNGVLGAMVEGRGVGVVAYPQQLPASHGTVPPSSAVFHRLPSIDASVRIDSKTTGKVLVRPNQIRIEKAGVPLFSVQWKVNRTP